MDLRSPDTVPWQAGGPAILSTTFGSATKLLFGCFRFLSIARSEMPLQLNVFRGLDDMENKVRNLAYNLKVDRLASFEACHPIAMTPLKNLAGAQTYLEPRQATQNDRLSHLGRRQGRKTGPSFARIGRLKRQAEAPAPPRSIEFSWNFVGRRPSATRYERRLPGAAAIRG